MDRELRVLIVEDSVADAELNTKELGKGGLVYASKWVKSKDEFLKALGEYIPDIILCDYAMPGFGAPEALEIVKKISPEIPFVVVSGAIGENVAVEMMKSGVADYVMKDNISRLPMVVTRAFKENEERVAHKQAEEKLSYFQKAVDSATDAIGMSTPEGRHYYQNEAFTELLGFSVNEVNGASVPPVAIYADEKVGHEVFDAIMKGDSFTGEVKMLAKDKSEKDISLRAYSIKDEKGKVIGLVGIHTDITERKKAEEFLRVSEVRYRSSIELTGQLAWITESNGEVVEDIPLWRKFTGFSYEETKGSGWTKALHPEDVEHTRQVWGNAVKDKSAYEVEFRLRRFDGVYRNFLTRGIPKFKEDGSIREWVGVNIDITERKKMNERLLAAAEEWRTTFDSISDMVSIFDKNYKIIRVNKLFADRFKMKPQDVIGKTCYELVHGMNEPPPGCPHRGTLETKMPQHSEYFEPHLDMYLEVTTSPIFNEKGDVVASVHIARDITTRKKLEKNQRLAELGKLVADMAHEVNNPLMIISGNAQLSLLDGTPDEEIKSNLKIIHEECNMAKDIIQRLLKFSRPTKGERKETDINQSIESVAKLIEYQFSLSDVKIKKDLKPGLPAIAIDEKQIQEVLMNLLNNAREAMPDGGAIDISTSKEQDFIRIDVKDSGMGMDEATLSRLFEPFFTTKEKGTGLGLAVCLGIVRAHNGELKFESQPGKGTTATMLLPIRGG
ncbi:MAG: PAS domain S-box protein [Candidatus Omnitrophota bacterium]